MTMRLGPAVALAIIMAWSLDGLAQQSARGPFALTGTVSRGGIFEQPLRGGLLFRLAPGAHGWMIWVGDPARPEENYAAVATPPYRGPNPIYIEGWHFRNVDNTGPNTAGPKNLNVPQHVRAFAFVRDRASFLAARDALGITMWPGAHGADEVAAAREAHASVAIGAGQLEIVKLELGNLRAGERAWIERMDFRLTIDDAAAGAR
jgi:hypothetical protein